MLSLGATIVTKENVGVVLVRTTMRLRTRLPKRYRIRVRKLRSRG